MDIKILDKSENRIKFVLEDANPAFANTLRRIMKNEIPTMAIETVYFEENTSGMFDELIAHRLGLIPLTFDQKSYNIKEECKCDGKGCSRCEVTLVLEKTGPCVVRSGDMKSTDDAVNPSDSNIPIIELLDGQRLKLEAAAQLGYGREHVKWQASNAGYKYMPSVKANADASTRVVDACPVNVFEKKDGKVRVVAEDKCILCMKCVEIDGDNVKVATDDTSFVFNVETVSGLSAGDVLNTALDVLAERAKDMAESVKKLK